MLMFMWLQINVLQVVVYRGTIREKPTSEKEAREFIKGLYEFQSPPFIVDNYRPNITATFINVNDIAGYSGSHAAVVGSVVVTNLATGKRYGGWESAEVHVAAT